MTQRYAPYLSLFSGNDVTSSQKRLSDGHRRQLIYAAKTINQVDLAIANNTRRMYDRYSEAESSMDTYGDEMEEMSFAREKENFEGWTLTVFKRQATLEALTTEADVVAYMSSVTDVPKWMFASTLAVRYQDDIFADEIKLGGECLLLARLILDLGCSLIEHLALIQSELLVQYPDVVFACRLRLNVIKSFYIVADQPTPSVNPFAERLDDFNAKFEAHPRFVEAYSSMDQSCQATLTATTLLIISLCLVPMVFSWKRSPLSKGTVDDADFWSIIQTMLMQLLGLFTMMFPISRFAPVAAWRYSWIFTAAAGICTVAAPILYVMVPTGWSSIFSYFASAAQAATVLQVMLGSNYVRTKTTSKKQ